MTWLDAARPPRLAAACGLALTLILGHAGSKVSAQAVKPAQQKPVADTREGDRKGIQSTMESFAKAFEARDAKGLAAHWTSEGEYQGDAGASVHGRAALERAFSEFFAKTPEVKADVRPELLRFLSADSGIQEGSVSIRSGAAGPTTHAKYRALFVREGGHWRLAQLIESSDADASIEDLAWLIGEWHSTSGQGAEIHTNYSWTPSKKFIRVEFSFKEKDRSLSGSQVIGIDPATGQLHTWTFEANGGVAEADWTRDGDHWVLDAVGTLPDGRTLVETNILTRINAETFTWQSVDRTLDDEPLADLPPVKVTRAKRP